MLPIVKWSGQLRRVFPGGVFAIVLSITTHLDDPKWQQPLFVSNYDRSPNYVSQQGNQWSIAKTILIVANTIATSTRPTEKNAANHSPIVETLLATEVG